MICAGEFIRNSPSKKAFIAGLWLGGWLLKPQLLIIILPLLIISRSFKVLKGFMLSSLLILATSFLMVGKHGFINLKDIILGSSSGGATSASEAMTNWRMLGTHIAYLTSQIPGDIIMIAGSLITAGVAIYVFRKKISDPNQLMIASLGIFAATCAATWHAHLHMSIILIPPMLYLSIKYRLYQRLFILWVVTPVLFQMFGYLIISLIGIEDSPTNTLNSILFIRGFPGLILNLVLFGWSIVFFNRLNESFTQT
jgi:hypothetical protein